MKLILIILQPFIMKNNLLKYLVAAALVINAATLIFFWYNRPPQDEKSGLRPARVLIEELKLDEKQQAIFHPLREQHHQAHDSLLKIIADKRQILYRQKQVANDSILHQIGLLNQEIERITYNHFMDIRKICTPEQQAQMDILLEKTVQNILMPKKKRRQPQERE
jgi:periplasmic protein CpxP/Spy